MEETRSNESDIKEEQEMRDDSKGEASQNMGSGSGSGLDSSSSFLPEMNLVFVLLSLLSHENSNGEEGELTKAKEVEAITTYNIARSSVKKKDVIEAKPERPRVAQRFHTTIKDHRHGRKM
ncbi:hypothetical protein SDJN02_09754, partial [Cucurbita argyrosperma subsp. argyrosperma]